MSARGRCSTARPSTRGRGVEEERDGGAADGRRAADAAAAGWPARRSSRPRSPPPPTASRCSTSRDGAFMSTPAGCALLGTPLADLLGRPAPFVEPDAVRRAGTPRRLLRWTVPDSPRERELEHRVARGAHRGRARDHRRHLPGRDRRPRAAPAVHRVRERRRERRVRRLAARHARRDLRELVETAGLAGAQIFLVDASGTRMRVTVPHPSTGGRRLRPAPRGGPPPRGGTQLVRGAADGRPVMTRRRKAQMLADPAWDAAARPARQLRLGRLRRRAAAGARPARRRAQRLLPPRARARRRRDRVPRPRWPTRPRSRWRTPGCSPKSGARPRPTSGTGWPASCTTPPASSCSR